MMLQSIQPVRLAGWLMPILFLLTCTPSQAVHDGLGTNFVGVLQAEAIWLDGELRTAWPNTDILESIGGTWRFRGESNVVYWAAAVRGDGQLESVRVQTDSGEADVLIIRAPWNADWNTYDEVLSLQATAGGVESDQWNSTWLSNTYRLGVVVTNYTTGTNLWWSVDYKR